MYVELVLQPTTLSERRFNLKAPDRINIRSNGRKGSINPLIPGIPQVYASFSVPLSTSFSLSHSFSFLSFSLVHDRAIIRIRSDRASLLFSGSFIPREVHSRKRPPKVSIDGE